VRLSVVTGVALGVILAVFAPWLPALFSPDSAVSDRATSATFVLAAMMLPAALAFAHDGILIGAGDYRFLGRAALGYLVVMVPIGLLVLSLDSAGIVGIWAGLFVWMVMRATVNHARTRHLLPHHSRSL
jgi:Na+-driven multidrug efflux pump